MLHRKTCLLFLGLAGLFLAGCAAFQTSTTQNLPLATEGKPSASQALITIEGTPSYSGLVKMYAISVYDNKTLVGKVGPNGKLVWLRDPGRMVLTLGVDSVYGADWCLGRIHTVEAGKTYTFKVQSAGLRYAIAGPGISIEAEQTAKFLAAWKTLRQGMSAGEIARFPGFQVPAVSSAGKDAIGNSWYLLDYCLGFNQGKLSTWSLEINVPCPSCQHRVTAPCTTGSKRELLFVCPSCGQYLNPTAQD